MFTGLIEATATVRHVTATHDNHGVAGPLRLELDHPWHDAQEPGDAVRLGDSIAIDGVCLTVAAFGPGEGKGAPTLGFDVGHETLQRTTLGTLRTGARVHLERALCFGARLGGHLVSGHVDAVAQLVKREQRGSSLYLGIAAPPEVLALSAPQGSVTLAGVSLTVTQVEDTMLWVCLIPHTLEVTHLGELQVGDSINCEADLLARYLRRLLAGHPWAAGRGAAADDGTQDKRGRRPWTLSGYGRPSQPSAGASR